MPDALIIARYAVIAIFAVSVLVAAGSWLVRTRKVSPFGAFARALRSVTDPIIRPVERRLVRMGGNPVNAGWWLVVVVAVVGVIFLSVLGWALNTFQIVTWAAESGPRASLALVVTLIYKVLFYAIILRVLASWLGFFRYSRWMRPVYALTDWLVVPIQRVVPPVGMFDVSPLVALLVLWALKSVLLTGLGF